MRDKARAYNSNSNNKNAGEVLTHGRGYLIAPAALKSAPSELSIQDSYITSASSTRTVSASSTVANMPSFQNPSSGSNGVSASRAPAQAQNPKKLILCFDGTGNTFSGSNADTNVVKILSQLDRNDPDQYHYYQSELLFAATPDKFILQRQLILPGSRHWNV